MTIVISGASGQLERLRRVRARAGRAAALILVTRDVTALATSPERGVVMRPGNFEDPVQLNDAFAGGDRLLLVSTDALGDRVRQHRDAIDAAVFAGLHFIAYTSIVNPGTRIQSPSPASTARPRSSCARPAWDGHCCATRSTRRCCRPGVRCDRKRHARHQRGRGPNVLRRARGLRGRRGGGAHRAAAPSSSSPAATQQVQEMLAAHRAQARGGVAQSRRGGYRPRAERLR